MRKSYKNEPEETKQVSLQIQKPPDSHEQKGDSGDLQINQPSPKIQSQDEASNLGITHEVRKVTQQEKGETSTEISGLLAQNAKQTSHPQDDATHQECDAFKEDKLLESYGNATLQQSNDIPKVISIVPEQESTQVIEQQANDGIHQEYDGCVGAESLKPKTATDLAVKQKEEIPDGNFLVTMQGPTPTAEQGVKDSMQKKVDTTIPKLPPLPLPPPNPLGESPYFLAQRLVQQAQQTEGSQADSRRMQQRASEASSRANEARSRSFLGRIRRHRTPAVQSQRLPPQPEHLPILEPRAGRNRGIPSWRLRALPPGIDDYDDFDDNMDIPPETQLFIAQLQWRCIKFICSLVVSGILVVALYFLIEFLEDKYGTGGTNATSPLTDFHIDLDIPITVLKSDSQLTDLDVNNTNLSVDLKFNITSPMMKLDIINNLVPNLEVEIIPLINDTNANVKILETNFDRSGVNLEAKKNDFYFIVTNSVSDLNVTFSTPVSDLVNKDTLPRNAFNDNAMAPSAELDSKVATAFTNFNVHMGELPFRVAPKTDKTELDIITPKEYLEFKITTVATNLDEKLLVNDTRLINLRD